MIHAGENAQRSIHVHCAREVSTLCVFAMNQGAGVIPSPGISKQRRRERGKMNGKDFGEMVCKTLGMYPGIVRSVVVEARPEDSVIITLEIPANSKEVLEWAQSENIKNPGRVVLIEVESAEMV
jgi:hypothetical protein